LPDSEQRLHEVGLRPRPGSSHAHQREKHERQLQLQGGMMESKRFVVALLLMFCVALPTMIEVGSEASFSYFFAEFAGMVCYVLAGILVSKGDR
jgi:hypothetical protein